MAQTLRVNVIGDTAELSKALANAQGDTKKFGKNLTKTLTPVAAGIAALGVLAFKDWHEAFVTLSSQTGATGDDLEDLKDSLGNVGKQAPETLGEIAEVMADLSVKTGLVGGPLEQLTDQFLDLERMGMGATADVVADSFKRWGVESEDLSGSLDMFFRAAQESGISVDEMAESLTKFAPALQGFGLSLPEATALLASFEAEGVPATKAMTGLTSAFSNFAKQGKDPQKALDEAIEKIKEFPDPTDAAAYAIEIFGKRAGPELAKAIRDGSFDLDKMLTLLEDSKGKIDATADSQQTLNDRFKMFRNRVFDALGPYGEWIGLVGGTVAAIGPSIVLVAELATAYKGLKTALQAATFWQLAMNLAALANPYVLIAVLIIAVAAAVVIAYKKPERFRTVADAVIGFVKRHWGLLLVFLTGGMSLAVQQIIRHWGSIKDKANTIINFVKEHWRIMLAVLTGGMSEVVIKIREHWDSIKDKAKAIFSTIKAAGASAFSGVRDSVQWVIDKVQTLIGYVQSLIGWINKIPLVPNIGGGAKAYTGPGGGRAGAAPRIGVNGRMGATVSGGGGGPVTLINVIELDGQVIAHFYAENPARPGPRPVRIHRSPDRAAGASLSFPALTTEVAFTTDPADPTPVWEDISGYVLGGDIQGASRQQILERAEGGNMRLTLRNDDRRFDPTFEGTLGNMVLNPSFETNTTGYTLDSWSPDSSGRVNAWAQFGSWSYKIEDTAHPNGGHFAGPLYSEIVAAPGEVWSARVTVNAVNNPSQVVLRLRWLTAGGATISVVFSTFSTATGVFDLTITGAVAPALTAKFTLLPQTFNASGATPACLVYFDGLQALEEATPSVYCDGDQPGCHWAGTPHASLSFDGAPYWPNVVPGRRVRVVATHDGNDYPLFSGFVDSWPQNWITPEWSTTDLVAGDGFYQFSNAVVGESQSWPEELSGARIERVLDEFGWPAADRDLEDGVSLIPAVTWGEDGVDALGHMQDVADSELGAFFIAADGLATFHDRHHRIAPGGAYTPLAVFGPDDIPYQEARPEYEAAWIINKAVITVQPLPNPDPDDDTPLEPGTGIAEDPTSRDRYGPRSHTRTPLLTDVNQAQSMAEWIVSLRKDPQLRFESLGFRMAAGTADDVYAEALGRLFGDRVTVKAEPAGGGDPTDVDCHIEGVSHSFSPMVWGASWQLSPAEPENLTYWILEDATYGELDVTTRLAV